MKTFAVTFSCLFAMLFAHEASAANHLAHFPRCPEGLSDKTCECRAGLSGRGVRICHAGQHCMWNGFHALCL